MVGRRQRAPPSATVAAWLRRRKSRSKALQAHRCWPFSPFPRSICSPRLIGSLIPVNRGWREPDSGITIYPGRQWHSRRSDPAGARRGARLGAAGAARPTWRRRAGEQWIAFGAGERRVYLDTPTWADISPRTLFAATAGGERVIHVQYTADPTYEAREIRVTPEQYRRLWTAIRAEFRLDRAAGRSASTIPATVRSMPFTKALAAPARCRRATIGSRGGCAWQGLTRLCGRPSRRGWCGASARPRQRRARARSATNRCRARCRSAAVDKGRIDHQPSRRRGPRR